MTRVGSVLIWTALSEQCKVVTTTRTKQTTHRELGDEERSLLCVDVHKLRGVVLGGECMQVLYTPGRTTRSIRSERHTRERGKRIATPYLIHDLAANELAVVEMADDVLRLGDFWQELLLSDFPAHHQV